MEEWEHDSSSEFNLIDFSSENDNLYFSVSPIQNQHQFQDSTEFETVGYMDSGNWSHGTDQLDEGPELGQSEEPQRIRSGKYNFRKSLAWDKAFFTSAGVLDPEELTCMMDGREAVKKKILPGIDEETQLSTDSISTLGSNSFSLESLEVELFADIRASIKKSSTAGKGSFGRKPIPKDGNQDLSSANGHSVSQNQFKSKPVIKKVVTVHNLGVPECQPKIKTVVLGSKKAVKTGSSRSVLPRSAITIGELASSPPKGSIKSRSATSSGTKVTSLNSSRLKTENSNAKSVSPRVSSLRKSSSTTSSGVKGTSLGPSRLKTENGNAKSVSPRVTSLSKCSSTTSSGIKVTSLGPSRLKTENGNAKTVAPRRSHESKISSSNGPCISLPVSESTSKSSSQKPSVAKTQSTRPSSKGASCDSPISEGEVKTPSAIVRRKALSRGFNLSSPSATPQYSSETALKNKVTPDNSNLSAYLLSSEIPSSISPASSVSEWSSISSSSAVNQKSNRSRSSVGSNSCRSEVGDALPFNIKARTNNQTTRCQEIKRSAESVKRPALQAGVLSGSSSTKPTGLRMPSPKIGYFDGVKSVHASSGAMHSHTGLPVALSKVGPGVSPRGISNIKHKDGKVPPGRVVTTKKHETQNPDAILPAQGNPQVSPSNGDHEKMVESPVKVPESGSEEHDKVISKQDLGVTKNQMMSVEPELNESKTVEISPKENNGVTSKATMLVDPEHNESKTGSGRLSSNAPKRLDAFRIDGYYDLESSFDTYCKIGEKENVPWEDRMDQSRKDGGGVKSETVDLQAIEPLQVTCSEVS